MPGRLMYENNLNASINKMDRPSQPDTPVKFEPSQDLTVPSNPPPRGESSVSLQQLPPEIEQITFGYQPLGRIFNRLSQQCFNDLNDLVAKLAEPSQINGTSVAVNASSDARKRLAWLEWANSSRDKFVKLSVLLEWSRNIEDINKLINLVAWTRSQDNAYTDTLFYLGEMQRNMISAKLPAPNLQIAKAVFAGQATSFAPHLNYIPPKPLTAQKTLKTLQNINILLQLRLNLHEDLPHQFRTFSIKSGRSTFLVPSEFEVDLSIADEDPTSQFFFIDFRLLFCHHSDSTASQLSAQLEGPVNHALANGGLAACYDLLHEFALTHKITLLRRQAAELSRTTWSGSTRVEEIHRTLVIQYWTNRPGPKSWIEIGVHSGKKREQTQSSFRKAIPSHLSIKWIREGKIIPYELTSLRLDDLDMERLLNSIIAQHIAMTLSTILERSVGDLAQKFLPTSANLHTSNAQPHQCTLTLSSVLSPSSNILIEPTSGRFAIQPVTSSSVRCASALNARIGFQEDYVMQIQAWQARELTERFENRVTSCNQIKVDVQLELESFERCFGKNVISYGIFKGKNWSASPWHIVFTVTFRRVACWIAKFVARPENQNHVVYAERMFEEVQVYDQDHFDALYLVLEQIAVAKIVYSALSTSLQSRNVPHRRIETDGEGYPAQYLQIELSALLSNKSQKSSTATLWAGKTLEVTNLGFSSPKASNCSILVYGSLVGNTKLYHLLSSLELPHVVFGKDGSFSLILEGTLGSDAIVDLLISRMESLQRLYIALKELQKHGISSKTASLDSIWFTYDNNDGRSLDALLNFSDKGKTSLELLPKESNPHRRMQRQLSDLLNSDFMDVEQAFAQCFQALHYNLPILTHITNLERRDRAINHVIVHKINLYSYTISYLRIRVNFDIRLRTRGDESLWELSSTKGLGLHLPSGGVMNVLKELYMDTGEGWMGLRTGVVANTDAILGVLERLDVAMMKLDESEGVDWSDALPSIDPTPINSTTTPQAIDSNAMQKGGHGPAGKAPLKGRQEEANRKPPQAPGTLPTGTTPYIGPQAQQMQGVRNNQPAQSQQMSKMHSNQSMHANQGDPTNRARNNSASKKQANVDVVVID